MSRAWRIERLEVLDVGDHVGPGDAGVFVGVHATGQTGWYGPIHSTCVPHLTELAEAVVGERVDDHHHLYGKLVAALHQCPDEHASWAIGAVDCAVWDLHGRLDGVPTARHLASSLESIASTAPAYVSWLSLNIADPRSWDTVATTARTPWLFTKWGLRLQAGTEIDVAAVARAVQVAALRAGGRIALDALRTWTVPLTEELLARINRAVLVWLEDPLPFRNRQAYRSLTLRGVRLATGEQLLAWEDPSELIDSARPDILAFDVVGCGGLTRAADLVTMARKAKIPMYPHGRSLVPGMHLAAAFPNAVPAVEYQIQWEPRRQALYVDPIRPRHGRLPISNRPGLGTTPRSR